MIVIEQRVAWILPIFDGNLGYLDAALSEKGTQIDDQVTMGQRATNVNAMDFNDRISIFQIFDKIGSYRIGIMLCVLRMIFILPSGGIECVEKCLEMDNGENSVRFAVPKKLTNRRALHVSFHTYITTKMAIVPFL